ILALARRLALAHQELLAGLPFDRRGTHQLAERGLDKLPHPPHPALGIYTDGERPTRKLETREHSRAVVELANDHLLLTPTSFQMVAFALFGPVPEVPVFLSEARNAGESVAHGSQARVLDKLVAQVDQLDRLAVAVDKFRPARVEHPVQRVPQPEGA